MAKKTETRKHPTTRMKTVRTMKEQATRTEETTAQRHPHMVMKQIMVTRADKTLMVRASLTTAMRRAMLIMEMKESLTTAKRVAKTSTECDQT